MSDVTEEDLQIDEGEEMDDEDQNDDQIEELDGSDPDGQFLFISVDTFMPVQTQGDDYLIHTMLFIFFSRHRGLHRD
jgi:hypothetical protein